ncbi:MAG: DUF3187 family protein [Woeseiaceae bacterium]|nr:DUF3187 family protein [Woeseiaceae bacterium]
MRRSLPILFLFCAGFAAADDAPFDAIPLRNHNPFLQIFGLPDFQTASLASDFTLSYDIANDADDKLLPTETLIIDGESQALNVALRRRIGERMELRIDAPWVWHSGGFLDATIKKWHSVLGLSNAAREMQNDRLQLLYERNGTTYFDLSSSTSGIGDVRLSAAFAWPAVTLRAGVKLPTGDAADLTGSGGTDFHLGAYLDRTTSFLQRDLDVSGFAGILLLGDGDVLTEFQRSSVPFGGLAFRWHATDRFALSTQWYVQGAYFDIGIDEIGGTTLQLGVGADYRFERSLFRLAIAEDIVGAAAPDFALHLSIRYFGG